MAIRSFPLGVPFSSGVWLVWPLTGLPFDVIVEEVDVAYVRMLVSDDNNVGRRPKLDKDKNFDVDVNKWCLG